MPENGKVPLLDIQYNVDYDLEIVSQKDGKSTYGPWPFYQLMFQGKKFGHFAQPVLHEKLKEFSMGDRVIIQKQQTEREPYQLIFHYIKIIQTRLTHLQQLVLMFP